MKQFGSAVSLYRNDNYGNIPQANNIWYIDYTKPLSTFPYHYYESLRPYMKNTGVAICPGKAIRAVKDSLGGLWYNPDKTPTRWYGAVYTPSMWGWKKDTHNSGFMAHMVWSKGNKVVNMDTLDFRRVYNCNSTEAIMLFCMSGTWTISWDDINIRKNFPDGIAHGTHAGGTPALFADGHVKFVNYRYVGNL
jgi:prepilin-type processing-associated H-X9-DG protein